MKLSKKTKKLLKSVSNKTVKNSKILFFFDYDGVLVPLQHNPATAFLPKNFKNQLVKLSRKRNVKIALVSGRNLKLLQKLSKIRDKDITLIGSHGLEMFYKGKLRHLFSNNVNELKEIKRETQAIAQSHSKGFWEKKPYSLTFHIRDVNAQEKVKDLSKAFRKCILKKKLGKKLQLLEGKKIVEILPVEVTKGSAVEKVIKLFPRYNYLYFGDDVTDISALKIVKRYKGMPVSLNPKLSYKTTLTLDSPREVRQFVEGVLKI